MNKRYDILEICLKRLENGASLESVLVSYPDQASELRPILKAAIAARRMAVPAPSSEVVRAGRAKLLQRAAEMREGKYAPSRKRVIPTFQRFALSFGLAATLLLSGTGLVGASASALPGEKLYPVKRTWEDVQLLFVFNTDAHDALKSHFENERLHEVSTLLEEGRDETIQFAGIYTLVDGITYISGLPVVIGASTQLPAQGLESGIPVSVSGFTNANGVVEITAITLLPAGTYVPSGQPLEVESTQDADSDPNSSSTPVPDLNTDSESVSIIPPTTSQPKTHSDIHYFEAEGTVEALSEFTLVLNGKTVYFDNVRISGDLVVGARVDIKGYYGSDGRFMVTEITVKQPTSDSNNNTGSDSGSSGGGSDPGHDYHDGHDGHNEHHDHE